MSGPFSAPTMSSVMRLRTVFDACCMVVMVLFTYQLCYWINDYERVRDTRNTLQAILHKLDQLQIPQRYRGKSKKVVLKELQAAFDEEFDRLNMEALKQYLLETIQDIDQPKQDNLHKKRLVIDLLIRYHLQPNSKRLDELYDGYTRQLQEELRMSSINNTNVSDARRDDESQLLTNPMIPIL